MGKGNRTFFWEDIWLGDRPLRDWFPRLYRVAKNKKALVQDRFSSGGRDLSWFFYFRRELRSFEEESVVELKAILEAVPLDLGAEDELIWLGDSFGYFSVKSLINLVFLNSEGTLAAQNLIWKSLAPPRVQLFVWCNAKRKILTRTDLRRRGLLCLDASATCPLCGLEDENIAHLLVTCPTVWRLWCIFLNLIGVSWLVLGSWGEVMESWSLPKWRLAWITIPIVVVWTIWKERNSKRLSRIYLPGCAPTRSLLILKPVCSFNLGRAVWVTSLVKGRFRLSGPLRLVGP